MLKTLSEKLEERLMVHHPDLVYLNNPSDAISAQSKGLQTLMLASNSIHSLPQDFPCLCPNLKELDMSYNFLTHVPFPFIFPDSLEKLNLTGNVLTSVNCAIPPPLNAFCTLPRASSDTRLVTSVPTEAFYCEQHGSPKLRNLISLRLDKCGLKSINFYSHTNSDLSSEDLQHHRFDPEAQVDVVGAKIESLCLSENLLKEVHPSIVHLKQLVTLRISQNTDIIQVPKELGRLRKLREIHFDGLNLINPPMELLGKGTRSHDIIGYLSSLYLRSVGVYARVSVGVYARVSVGAYARVSVGVYTHVSVGAYARVSVGVYTHVSVGVYSCTYLCVEYTQYLPPHSPSPSSSLHAPPPPSLHPPPPSFQGPAIPPSEANACGQGRHGKDNPSGQVDGERKKIGREKCLHQEGGLAAWTSALHRGDFPQRLDLYQNSWYCLQ